MSRNIRPSVSLARRAARFAAARLRSPRSAARRAAARLRLARSAAAVPPPSHQPAQSQPRYTIRGHTHSNPLRGNRNGVYPDRWPTGRCVTSAHLRPSRCHPLGVRRHCRVPHRFRPMVRRQCLPRASAPPIHFPGRYPNSDSGESAAQHLAKPAALAGGHRSAGASAGRQSDADPPRGSAVRARSTGAGSRPVFGGSQPPPDH